LSFSHGSSNLELNRASWASSSPSIHQYKHYCASVSACCGQKITIPTLFFKLGKISNLTILEMLICLLKTLSCWIQWALNRGKWLSIKRVVLKWNLMSKWYFARCFHDR
jgi:hypothetical protein